MAEVVAVLVEKRVAPDAVVLYRNVNNRKDQPAKSVYH